MADPMEAVRRLLGLRHRGVLEHLPAALLDAAPFIDATHVSVLLVDYEQIAFWPLSDGTPRITPALPVDGSPAGHAFCATEMVSEEEPDGVRLWLPLLHGAERLGVLDVRLKAEPGDELRRDLTVVAALVAELIASRRAYGDSVEQTRRRLPMQLAAEIVWNQLPPLTFATGEVVVAAVLEPCYDVGGDAFDYAANGNVLHVALFDTVGHGIAASALTTLTLNTYRNARRCGMNLPDTYRSIDKWIRAQHPGSFVTAVMAELDTVTGDYRRISAGHPAELVIRNGAVLTPEPTPSALPLGLGHMRARGPGVTEQRLEPGDALLLYTDGITEARSADGALFGLDRLSDFIVDQFARRVHPAEAMRRLIHTIVSYENGELRDDATASLLVWGPTR